MSRLRSLLVLVVVLVVAGTCIRLGLWQLGRWREKQAANRTLAAALAAPARPLPAGATADGLPPGRWQAAGRFDESRQFVLVGRSNDGDPGVHLVTPLVRDDGGPAVLVDRGFVPSPDATTARPLDFPEPAPRVVTGLVDPLARRAGNAVWQRAAADSLAQWTTRWLDPDSVAAALPYAVAPLVLRELPGDGVPAQPIKGAARFADTMVHLSYAGQWFFFALVALVGPLILGRARRRKASDPGGRT